MIGEAIFYDSSLFERILSFPAYRAKNSVVINKCVKELEKETKKWVKIGGEVEEQSDNTIASVATNVIGMTLILNRINEMLKFIEERKTLEIETDDGMIETKQLDFMTNHVDNKEGFEKEYERFHILTEYFKEYLLREGSATYEDIIKFIKITVPIKQESNIFIKNLHQFFPKATDVKALESLGGEAIVFVDFNYRGNSWNMIVIKSDKIEKDGEYWKVWPPIIDINLYKFIVFVLPTQYAYLFDSDKTKIRDVHSTLNDRTSEQGLTYLFHNDTLMNYRKLL